MIGNIKYIPVNSLNEAKFECGLNQIEAYQTFEKLLREKKIT